MLTYSLTLLAHHPAICARARFPAGHVAFEGHFPGQPILPGFMHVQLALDALALARSQPSPLAEVHGAKFLRPCRPEEDLTVEITSDGGSFHVTIFAADDICSRFTLTLRV